MEEEEKLHKKRKALKFVENLRAKALQQAKEREEEVKKEQEEFKVAEEPKLDELPTLQRGQFSLFRKTNNYMKSDINSENE